MALRVEYPGIRPIDYGGHEIRNEVTEAKIRFLEDPANDDKPLPRIFRESEVIEINEIGRRAYAEKKRGQLLGLPGG